MYLWFIKQEVQAWMKMLMSKLLQRDVTVTFGLKCLICDVSNTHVVNTSLAVVWTGLYLMHCVHMLYLDICTTGKKGSQQLDLILRSMLWIFSLLFLMRNCNWIVIVNFCCKKQAQAALQKCSTRYENLLFQCIPFTQKARQSEH